MSKNPLSREEIARLSNEELKQLISFGISEQRQRAYNKSVSAIISRLLVGESTFVPGRKSYLMGKEKTYARKRLNDFNADWSSKLKGSREVRLGLRITRTQ